MNDLLQEIIVNDWFQLISTVGLVIAWIVDRRKRKVDFNTSRVSMLDNIDDLYDKFSERFKKEYQALLLKVERLEKDLEEANTNRENLMRRVEGFERQSLTDKQLISELTAKVDKQQETIESQKLRINQLERSRV